jgi:hypothetical protein
VSDTGQEAEGLAAALYAELGPNVTRDLIRHYAAVGWTGTAFRQIADLGTWSYQHELGLLQRFLSSSSFSAPAFREDVRITLEHRWEDLTCVRPRAHGDVMSWLALLAGAVDGPTASALEELTRDRSLFDVWLRLGRAGVFGYAAGLTLTEVAEQATSDDPSAAESALRMMALLRGSFLFAPALTEQAIPSRLGPST